MGSSIRRGVRTPRVARRGGPTARRRTAHVRALAPAILAALMLSACGDLVTVRATADVVLPPPARTSVMVDADGGVLAELHAEEDREPVPLEDVPPHLREAVVAIEDERFYHHPGVDARALARAVAVNSRAGRIAQGGSTITQQLAKNTVTGDEQTLARKVEEASVALQLERIHTKDEILEQYLNLVYFGNGAYGVQAAAERYFGVPVGELDLAASALLAGMIRSPADTDPFAHPDAARSRRDTVLARMAARGIVTEAEAAHAAEAPLGVTAAPQRSAWRAPWFVASVMEALQHDPAFAALGDDPRSRADRIFRGGLRIETTLDAGWQQSAEEAVAGILDRPDDPRGALVAIDPSTGGIRAMVGGRDWDDAADPVARFNLATQARRQPGSVFKAIVLATALEQGWTLDRTLPGGATTQLPAGAGEPEPWFVRNYGGHDYGEVTLREATAQSVNTAFARLVEEVGPEAVVETATALGVRTPLRPLRSIALGAQEVSVLDMASVQATLAAGGVHRPPTMVTRITDAGGAPLYRRPAPDGTRVLSEEVAWGVTSALEGVVDVGTGDRADLRRPTAGKTGTTQDGADAWFAGFTPDLAAAVWVGFHEGRLAMEPPRTRMRVEGGTWPAEIFARFGLRALADVPASDFPVPHTVRDAVEVDLVRDCLPTAFTPPERVGLRRYPPGAQPPPCDDAPVPTVADVPDVVGLDLGRARAVLAEAGLRAVEEPTYTVTAPPEYAIGQDPPAGPDRTLVEGRIVRVRVSSADRTKVRVPTVIGLPVTEAVTTLRAAGFPVDVSRACPEDGATAGPDVAAPVDAVSVSDCGRAPGVVHEQQPGAGEAFVHTVVSLRAAPG